MTQIASFPWSGGEDKTLRNGVKAGRTIGYLARVLPDRTKRAIQNRAKLLGLTVSTREVPIMHRLPSGIDGEIAKLCSYITSDSSIAVYLSTPVERVATVRKRMAPSPADTAAARSKAMTPIAWEGRGEKADGEQGSTSLRNAILRLYADAAHRERTTILHACLALNHGASAAAKFIEAKGNAHV